MGRLCLKIWVLGLDSRQVVGWWRRRGGVDHMQKWVHLDFGEGSEVPGNEVVAICLAGPGILRRGWCMIEKIGAVSSRLQRGLERSVQSMVEWVLWRIEITELESEEERSYDLGGRIEVQAKDDWIEDWRSTRLFLLSLEPALQVLIAMSDSQHYSH